MLKLNPLNILHPNDSMNSQEIFNELFDALIFHACCCHDTISILFLTCSRVPRPLKKGSSRDGRRESSDFFEWDIGQHYSINSFSVVLVSFVFPNNVTTNRWVQLLSRSLRNQTCGWDGFLSLSRVSSINSSLPTNMEMDNGSASPISELTFIYSTESYWNYAMGTCELIHILYIHHVIFIIWFSTFNILMIHFLLTHILNASVGSGTQNDLCLLAPGTHTRSDITGRWLRGSPEKKKTKRGCLCSHLLCSPLL